MSTIVNRASHPVLSGDDAVRLVWAISNGKVRAETVDRGRGIKLRIAVEGLREKSQFPGSRYGEKEQRPVTGRMHQRVVEAAVVKAAKDTGVSLDVKPKTIISEVSSIAWVLRVESRLLTLTNEEIKVHTDFMERLGRELRTVLGAS